MNSPAVQSHASTPAPNGCKPKQLVASSNSVANAELINDDDGDSSGDYSDEEDQQQSQKRKLSNYERTQNANIQHNNALIKELDLRHAVTRMIENDGQHAKGTAEKTTINPSSATDLPTDNNALNLNVGVESVGIVTDADILMSDFMFVDAALGKVETGPLTTDAVATETNAAVVNRIETNTTVVNRIETNAAVVNRIETNAAVVNKIVLNKSDWPAWLGEAHEYLASVSGDLSWVEAVNKFTILEQVLGFQDGSDRSVSLEISKWQFYLRFNDKIRLDSACRPNAVQVWFKYGRKYDQLPKITDMAHYEDCWWNWWHHLQPVSRKGSDGKWLKKVDNGEEWKNIKKGGPSGFFIIMLTLSWWLKLSGMGEKFQVAVDDVVWVLDQLTGAHSSGLQVE